MLPGLAPVLAIAMVSRVDNAIGGSVMTAKIKDNKLILDLENSQISRDVAFNYAMDIMEDDPEGSMDILKLISKYEDMRRKAK